MVTSRAELKNKKEIIDSFFENNKKIKILNEDKIYLYKISDTIIDVINKYTAGTFEISENEFSKLFNIIKEKIINKIDEIRFTYYDYDKAIAFLMEHDPSLIDSLEIIRNLGYTINDDINSEVLATALYRHMVKKEYESVEKDLFIFLVENDIIKIID